MVCLLLGAFILLGSFTSAAEAALAPNVRLVPNDAVHDGAGNAYVLGRDWDTGAPFVQKILPSGQPDSSFGTSGVLLLGGTIEDSGDIEIRTDGKIVGSYFDRSYESKVFVIDSNGALDSSFGTGGVVSPGTCSAVEAVVTLPDSGIALLDGNDGECEGAFIKKLGSNGGDVGEPFFENVEPPSFDISDGAVIGNRLLVPTVTPDGVRLLGLNLDMTLDASFGNGGYTTILDQVFVRGYSALPSELMTARSLNFHNSVGIYPAGDRTLLSYSFVQADDRIAAKVVALDAAGQLDVSYGTGGTVIVPLAHDTVLSGDGHVDGAGGLVLPLSLFDAGDGSIEDPGLSASSIVRITPSGSFDTSLAEVRLEDDPNFYNFAFQAFPSSTPGVTRVLLGATIENDAPRFELRDVSTLAPARAGARFTSLSPARVWDSRVGPGPVGRIGAGGVREVTVTGVGGVPATGVTAVVLNVTAVAASAGTYVTAWPTGELQPNASNLNIPPGDTRPNLVIVKVGAGGKVSFYNDVGTVDLIADIAGWVGDPAP